MINNKYGISLDRILSVPLPAETETYKPIPYKEVNDFVLDNFNRVDKSSHFSINGGYAIKSIYEFDVNRDLKGCIVINNSYDKSVAFRATFAMMIKVCSNGMFMNIINSTYRRKHVEDVQLEYKNQVLEKITSIDTFIDIHLQAKAKLEAIEMSKEDMYKETLDIVLDRKFSNRFRNYGKIRQQIEHPSFNYHNGNTRWDFYNHCTLAARDSNLNAFDINNRKIASHFRLETLI